MFTQLSATPLSPAAYARLNVTKLSLVVDFSGFFKEHDWNSHHVPDTINKLTKAEIVALAIKEAKELEIIGKTDIAIALLEKCIEEGLPPEWILHNKATYLSKLGSFDTAHTIWNELIAQGKPQKLVDAAEKALSDSKEQQASTKENPTHRLLNQLQAAANAQSWPLEHLDLVNDDSQQDDITIFVIKESFRARKESLYDLSLTLINLAIEAGLDSPWLLENKAQSLSALKQFDAAHFIWEELISQTAKPKLVEIAKNALSASKDQQKQAIAENSLHILEKLHTIAGQHSWEPTHLPNHETLDQELDLNVLLIKESFSARKKKKNQLSLELIDTGLDHGLDSPWLLDNKAQSLVNLGDFESAKIIWEGLLNCKGNAKILQTAQQSLDCLEESKRQHEEERPRQLIESFQEIANQHQWTFQNLPRLENLENGADIEVICLKEAIIACNQDNPQLSILLLDTIMDYGYQSPWLSHNKAIALLKTKEHNAAISIWNALKESDNKNIAAKAHEFLALALRENNIERASSMAETGNTEEAVNFLVESLCKDPDCKEYSDQLKQLIEESLTEEIQAYESDPELKNHFLQLQLNSKVIDYFQKNLKDLKEE